jgi:hypothetical protein
MNKSIRTLTLAAVFAVTLGVSGVVAAQPPRPVAVQAGTPTPIDSSAPVKLELGKPFETYFDGQDLYSAYFQFSGKANQLIEVTLEKTKGSFGITAYVSSQNDVELADIHGAFLDSASVTVKLPQDGNYKIQIQSDKPGAGDLEPGSLKVTVSEKKKAAPAAAATAVVTAAATAAK